MFLPSLKSHDSAHRLCSKYYLCVVLLCSPNDPATCALGDAIPFNGKPHLDHLMGPPPCHSDLSLTCHLKVAIPDHPLPCLLIDYLSLIRECESQEGSIFVCPALSPLLPSPHTHLSYLQHLEQCLAHNRKLVNIGFKLSR